MQTAETVQPSLLARDDTFFGVCAGLGEDFGFNPTFLRVAFAALLFFNPLAALGTYAALGALVLVTRLLFPNPRPAFAQAAVGEPGAAHQPSGVENHRDPDMLAVAA